MKISRNILKDKIFYWMLTFVAITLPFPAYSINSQAIIILLVYWIFYNSFNEKLEILKENKFWLLLLSSPFLIAILGLIYTADVSDAFRDIELKVPFLVLPLVFFSVKLSAEITSFILKYFTYAVLVATVLAGSKVLYFKINALGNYFYYDRFSEFLDKHTTYFSLFVVVCMLILLHRFLVLKHKRFYLLAGYGFFIFVLYILSVRISIIALLIGTIILLLYHLNLKQKLGAIFILPLLFGSLYFTPNFQKRFQPSITESTQMNDTDFRKLHWKAVVETIKHNSILIGNGTRGNRDYLYAKYKEYKLTSAYEEEYNAHNQYLEILLDYGLFGLLVFLFFIFYLFKLFINSKDALGVSFLCVFIFYMFTESILERQSGIVLFSLVIPLLVYKNLSVKIKTRA